jgi:hypothetical protein
VYGEWFVESHRLGGARVSVGNPTLARHLVMFCVRVTVWAGGGERACTRTWLWTQMRVGSMREGPARGAGERGRRESLASAARERESVFERASAHSTFFAGVYPGLALDCDV